MKKNELGFMLAETLIVATFISVILIYLFVQFRNINNNYEKTLKYNGVNEMYILEQVYNYLGNIDLNQMSSNIIYGDKMKARNKLNVKSKFNSKKENVEILFTKALIELYENNKEYFNCEIKKIL